MVITIAGIVLLIASICFAKKWKWDIVSTNVFVVAICIIFGICLLLLKNAITSPTAKVKYQTKYEAITFAIRNNSDRVYLIADEIAEYNADVTNGRRRRNNPFISWFEYSFWNDIELIDYKSSFEQGNDR